MYTLRFDGLFRSIEGKHTCGFLGFGWLITRNHVLIAQGYGMAARSSDATSCIAEYLALIDGLEMLRDLDAAGQAITVVCDAKVVISQMRGASRVGAWRVKPLYLQARKLARQLQISDWEWVPRQNNKAADKLTRRAMRELRRDPQHFNEVLQTLDSENRRQINQLHFLSGMQVILQNRREDSQRGTNLIEAIQTPSPFFI